MDHAPRATAPQALVADVAVAATSDGLSALDDPETSRRLAAKVRVISEDASGECAPLLRREPNGAVSSVAKVNGATPECPKGVVNSVRKASGDSAGVRPALHVQFRGRDDDAPGERCPSSASSSSSSSEDDSSVSLSEARPPDGGWGWVVVAASFAVNLIADGVTFSFGVIFVHFLEYFGEGKAKTAWIGSLFMAMPLLSGPIASFLTDRYGCRKVTMVGSVLACLGFVASAFATSMEALFFTFGVLAGFGLSLCYVAAVVIVAYYFEKKRSLATGLSVCGSGIGTFIFAPLTQILLDEYGWRGTTLILAGCFLNMAVCGALMRDLPWTTTMIKAKAKDRKRSREQKRLKRYESSVDSISDSKSSNAATQAQAAAEACDELSRLAERNTRQFSSLVDLPTYVAQGEHLPYEVLELMSNRRHVYDALLQNCPGLMIPSRSFSDSGRLHEAASRSPPPPSPLALSPGANEPLSKSEYQKWLQTTHNVAPGPGGRPKLATAFLKDLRLHRHSLTYRGAMLNINRYRLRASSCPNIYRNSMTTIAKEKVQWYAGLWDLWDLIVDVLDFSHFANPKFLLFAVSNFLLYTWYDVPYVYIADNAMEMGYTESQSSMLISSIGILNMVGEILLGWAGDVECLNAGVVYAGCMLLCGGVTALLPLVTSYSGMTAVSGMFGLFIAANYSLTSIILVELITLEKFTNAYGLLLLVQGVANLIGPPLAGWMYDVTGSYDLSFYMSGLFIALSGVLLVILPIMKLVRRYRARQANLTQTTPTNSRVDNNIEVANGDVIKSDHNKYSKVYL